MKLDLKGNFGGTGLIWWVVCIILITYLLNHFNVGFDDTDNHDTHIRSGLVIYTDYRTGCQYLQGGFFGDNITPRLGKDGKQICKAKK